MDDIGRKIYLLRTIHNYTQAHLMEQLGISNGLYSSIETDGSKIPLDRLNKLVSVYGLSLKDFFSFEIDDLLSILRGKQVNISGKIHSQQQRLLSQLEAVNKVLFRLIEAEIIK